MIGIIIGMMFAIATLSQTKKLIKTKSSKDISLLTYILTSLAIFASDIVAIIENVPSLIISNSISLLLISINLSLIIKYKKWKTIQQTTGI